MIGLLIRYSLCLEAVCGPRGGRRLIWSAFLVVKVSSAGSAVLGAGRCSVSIQVHPGYCSDVQRLTGFTIGIKFISLSSCLLGSGISAGLNSFRKSKRSRWTMLLKGCSVQTGFCFFEQLEKWPPFCLESKIVVFVFRWCLTFGKFRI